MSDTTVIAVTAQQLQPKCVEDLPSLGISLLVCGDTALLPSMVDGVVDIVLLDRQFVPDAAVEHIVEACGRRMIPIIDLVPVTSLESYFPLSASGDFVVIPSSALELLTRINRILRAGQRADEGRVLRIGTLAVDFERYEVTVRGEPALLTYKEYQLLVVLASNPGIVFTRENLLTRVWGYDYFGGTRTVDVHVRRLRSKLGEDVQSYIETVWNVGYRLREPRSTYA
jgi:DNA-binding response OmpR family regulator